MLYMLGALCALFALAGGSRVGTADKFKSQIQLGTDVSCENLQARFGERLEVFQNSLDAIPDMDAVGRATQARMMMRTYGIIRTLRRARNCQWVIQNDSEEIQQARGIVQSLLAGNPCAGAARSEMQLGLSVENAQMEIASIRRAMSVLTSDSCEATESSEEHVSADGTDVDSTEAEDMLVDAIEAMEEGDSSFLQMDSSIGSLRGFMRGLGIAFLMLFLLLACTASLALIGLLIGIAVSVLVSYAGACPWGGQPYCNLRSASVLGQGFFLATGVTGLAGCAYQLYTQLLPRLTQ